MVGFVRSSLALSSKIVLVHFCVWVFSFVASVQCEFSVTSAKAVRQSYVAALWSIHLLIIHAIVMAHTFPPVIARLFGFQNL